MIIPYLAFHGKCEEAFNRYIGIFGGRILWMSQWTKETGGPAMAGKVMHAEAEVGGSVLSGGDQEKPARHTQAFSLMVHLGSRTEAEECCRKLARGGRLLQRLTPHPPPDDGGMGALVKDAYGNTWIITSPNDGRREERAGAAGT